MAGRGLGVIGGIVSSLAAIGYVESVTSRPRTDLINPRSGLPWPNQDCTDTGARSLEVFTIIDYITGACMYFYGSWACSRRKAKSVKFFLFTFVVHQILSILLGICNSGRYTRSLRRKDPELDLACYRRCAGLPPITSSDGAGGTPSPSPGWLPDSGGGVAACRLQPTSSTATASAWVSAAISAGLSVYFGYIIWSVWMRCQQGSEDAIFIEPIHHAAPSIAANYPGAAVGPAAAIPTAVVVGDLSFASRHPPLRAYPLHSLPPAQAGPPLGPAAAAAGGDDGDVGRRDLWPPAAADVAVGGGPGGWSIPVAVPLPRTATSIAAAAAVSGAAAVPQGVPIHPPPPASTAARRRSPPLHSEARQWPASPPPATAAAEDGQATAPPPAGVASAPPLFDEALPFPPPPPPPPAPAASGARGQAGEENPRPVAAGAAAAGGRRARRARRR